VRIVLMGTGPFAVPSFDALLASGKHEIPLVVTRPIKNLDDGKGRALANPVRAWAEQHALTVIDPQSINDLAAIAAVAQFKPDLLVVCDYGQILSTDALRAARLGGVNLHGSLLPRHRGAAPVQWSILRGDATTGACVIHMTPKLDGGPILCRVTTPIAADETAGDLEKRLSALGVQSCLQAVASLAEISNLDEAEGLGERQDPTLATPAPRLAKADGQLDFRFPAYLIDRQIRGLSPWPGTFGTIQIGNAKEIRVIIGRARLTGLAFDATSKSGDPVQSLQSGIDLTPGRIFWGQSLREFIAGRFGAAMAEGDRLPQMAVACSDELLEIEQIQPSGKKMQQSREFLAGYGKAESMRFVAPAPDRLNPLLQKMQAHSVSGTL
jgi:methionyl-tRNA formyltransferase